MQTRSRVGLTSIDGNTLRRLRKIKNMKQEHLADLMNVNQTTVSRWEHELIRIPPEIERRMLVLFDIEDAANQEDPLSRLVSTSSLKVHLICDRTHRLIAASRRRAAEWRIPLVDLLGRSLLPFATKELLSAEERLKREGWRSSIGTRAIVSTGANLDPKIKIMPGRAIWERVLLSSGLVARVVTTIED